MARLIIIEIALFVLPWLIWAIWTRFRLPVNAAPHLKLVLAGAVLVGLGLIPLARSHGGNGGGTYVPAHFENGVFIPDHFEQ